AHPRFDETSYARLASKRFGTLHTEFIVEPSSVDLVDRLVWHHDGPFADSSAIPTYLLSRLAREHVTVALNGDGGDELFAGYLRFYATLLSEGLPARCAQEMTDLTGVVALGANCIVGPQRMLDLVRMIAETTDLPILAFPTPGMPQLVRGAVAYDTSPEYFAKAAARLVDEGARLVGGCCGTTPQHICRLSQELKGKRRDAKPRVSRLREAKEREALAQTDPSELGLKLGHKFVVSVELDVPRGLNLDKLLAGARVLKVQGADVINISDGARARLRMNPSAVAALIQGRVGIEVTMHFSCRDRNLLAIQSDLLGCHAIGVRNILAVTGDPAHIGDYPSATSVFDIDSVGLVRTLSRFNEGIDMAGYSLGIKCGFTIACAYNPLPI
ncbi:MAG: homocysteine S-methyltransferase family protein, partial [Fimbriimonas ginsengisoli]|nr:homocysteine S-methyltransferase family protein [Fimbriimonas ginsengisoli]